jgi:hypothetical protein
MAPRLAASRHQLIGDMILDGTLKHADIAKIGGCSVRSVRAIASSLGIPLNGRCRVSLRWDVIELVIVLDVPKDRLHSLYLPVVTDV